MECRYMRIQGREDSWITKYPKGIFGMCWRLIMDGVMEPEDEKTFRAIDEWFRENLPEPEQCKKQEKVITFFKTVRMTLFTPTRSERSFMRMTGRLRCVLKEER